MFEVPNKLLQFVYAWHTKMHQTLRRINILWNNTIMEVKMRRNWKTSDTFTKNTTTFSCPSSGSQQLTLIYIFVRSLRLDIKPTVSCNMCSAIGLKLIFTQSNKKSVTENCFFMQRRCLLDIYIIADFMFSPLEKKRSSLIMHLMPIGLHNTAILFIKIKQCLTRNKIRLTVTLWYICGPFMRQRRLRSPAYTFYILIKIYRLYVKRPLLI